MFGCFGVQSLVHVGYLVFRYTCTYIFTYLYIYTYVYVAKTFMCYLTDRLSLNYSTAHFAAVAAFQDSVAEKLRKRTLEQYAQVAWLYLHLYFGFDTDSASSV